MIVKFLGDEINKLVLEYKIHIRSSDNYSIFSIKGIIIMDLDFIDEMLIDH